MTKKWFWIGMAGVFLLSLALRFWGLERFNTLVFDEVYYAKFGNGYLTHTPFFDGHPPLGKYMIALGIWLSSHLGVGQDMVNGLTGSLRSPINYRWINAFSGSFIPILLAMTAYELSYRRSFALLAGLFAACDGLFLVESRYALINQYIVIFGLLGQWLLLKALAKPKQKRRLWLVLAGLAFGASVATKWNGLGFLLGTYLVWLAVWGLRWWGFGFASSCENDKQVSMPLANFTQLNLWQMLFYLGVIPAIIYSLLWIPHLQLDTRYGFIEVHKQILQFHGKLGGTQIHPYCSAWYTWPLMIRPMAYYYQTAQSLQDPIPVLGPSLPSGYGKVIYDVHAMGNPFLWWFGAATILFLIGLLVQQIIIPGLKWKNAVPKAICADTWIALYIVINYAAHLLPWAKVSRCLFIYHYMTAVVFAFLAIAWLVDQCLRSYHWEFRAFGVTLTFVVLVAFVFWLPIYLGLPLSLPEYQLRMWFRSWI